MSDFDRGTVVGVQVAAGLTKPASIDDVLVGKVDTRDDMRFSRIITRKGSGAGSGLAYDIFPIEDGPQRGRLWELLHMSIIASAAGATPDPFTVQATIAIACILDETPQNSATEPASFNDIVGKFASIDGTPQYPPSRRGALLRYPQRLVFITKTLPANVNIACSAAFIDHDEVLYLSKLNG